MNQCKMYDNLVKREKIILDLCGGTEAFSKPYRDNGYDVRVITLPGNDVRLYMPPENVYGILSAPPCTHLAGSGARWWKDKGEEALFEALATVDACMRIILLSKPKMYFQPYDYGDTYSKKTALWGEFNEPKKNPVIPTEKDKIWKLPPSENRAELRSITSEKFAQAFYEENK